VAHPEKYHQTQDPREKLSVATKRLQVQSKTDQNQFASVLAPKLSIENVFNRLE
jgi:hypothetical protein